MNDHCKHNELTRKKLPSIEVGPTALARPMTLTFNLLRAIVMTYLHAKVQGQRSISSKDREETNGRSDRRTEAIALHPLLM